MFTVFRLDTFDAGQSGRTPREAMMTQTVRNTARGVFGLLVGAALLILGLRVRALEERNRGLVRRFSEPHPGLLVPAFKALTVSGDSLAVAAVRDTSREVVFFFTTTCAYCQASIPRLRDLHATLGSGLVLVGLDSSKAVARFADSLELPMPVAFMPDLRTTRLYRIRSVPQLMVFDSTGRAVYTRAGALLGQAEVDSVVAATRTRAASPLVDTGRKGSP